MRQKKNEYLRLFGYMRYARVQLIFAIFLAIIVVIANVIAPLYLAGCIDCLAEAITDETAQATFVTDLLSMLGCYIVLGVATFLSNYILIGIAQKQMRKIRGELNEKLGRLPLSYYDSRTYGDIRAVVTSDVETISNTLTTGIYQILTGILEIIAVIIMMIRLNKHLAFYVIVMIPIMLFVTMKFTKRSSKNFIRQTILAGQLNGYVEEYYSGHDLVSLFRQECQVNKQFDDINDRIFNEARRGFFLSGILTHIIQLLSNTGYIFVVSVGAVLAISSGFSIGMIQVFLQYLTQLTTPINDISQLSGMIQSTGAAAKRVFELMDAEEESDKRKAVLPQSLYGKVEFINVRFGYQPECMLMKDISFTVQPGEKIAIVGPTGAGKTTLVNLLMRFYDLNGGSILVDGIDISLLQRDELRKTFGVVLQDTWLFQGSIMENIRYGKMQASDEAVYMAARAARAHDFIMTLPGGYDFILSEGAENIAQGQRQLLTIARAMLSNPPIMILDEATSSVDTRTEVMIQEALSTMMRGRTSFVIAHRLSTITDSNRIFYMENGNILEIGTHEELLSKNGKYAKLYASQFADQEE